MKDRYILLLLLGIFLVAIALGLTIWLFIQDRCLLELYGYTKVIGGTITLLCKW